MPVCDFSLLINTNRNPISYGFKVIADYCSNFGHCVLTPHPGGLGAAYTVHVRLIVGFLFVLI